MRDAARRCACGMWPGGARAGCVSAGGRQCDVDGAVHRGGRPVRPGQLCRPVRLSPARRVPCRSACRAPCDACGETARDACALSAARAWTHDDAPRGGDRAGVSSHDAQSDTIHIRAHRESRPQFLCSIGSTSPSLSRTHDPATTASCLVHARQAPSSRAQARLMHQV